AHAAADGKLHERGPPPRRREPSVRTSRRRGTGGRSVAALGHADAELAHHLGGDVHGVVAREEQDGVRGGAGGEDDREVPRGGHLVDGALETVEEGLEQLALALTEGLEAALLLLL